MDQVATSAGGQVESQIKSYKFALHSLVRIVSLKFNANLSIKLFSLFLTKGSSASPTSTFDTFFQLQSESRGRRRSLLRSAQSLSRWTQ
jgi:hypothetical protein